MLRFSSVPLCALLASGTNRSRTLLLLLLVGDGQSWPNSKRRAAAGGVYRVMLAGVRELHPRCGAIHGMMPTLDCGDSKTAA
ncbi:hypothetical protein QBC45DRAFT_46207 [Copromyces sp. CBS 386.78]|nr:hypothetical protein QBC45DRAFT_46207 [Copromyces sp. CBS 386.78]